MFTQTPLPFAKLALASIIETEAVSPYDDCGDPVMTSCVHRCLFTPCTLQDQRRCGIYKVKKEQNPGLTNYILVKS